MLVISIVILGLAGVGWLIYKKINELNGELIKHEEELKKLNEKLKIYGRLNKLEEKAGI